MCAGCAGRRARRPRRRACAALEDLPGPVDDGVGELVHGALAAAQQGLHAEAAERRRRPPGVVVGGAKKNRKNFG